MTTNELTKAKKNTIRSMFVFGLQSNLQRAMQLAEFEMYWGDPNLLRTEIVHYQKVDNAQIKQVAQTYFTEKNETVLDVVPARPSNEATRKP
ncbi:MAG: hypothetical protein R3A47_02605 [Polyangiales bacterium]